MWGGGVCACVNGNVGSFYTPSAIQCDVKFVNEYDDCSGYYN